MEPSRILLVEDNEIDKTQVASYLEKKGFHVTALSTAANILEEVNKNKSELVLMDIMMPLISGKQALFQIREKYSLIELPVIMLTAKTESADIFDSFCIGANDYITKPIDFEVMYMRIRAQLKLSELSRGMTTQKISQLLGSVTPKINIKINDPLELAIIEIEKFLDAHPNEKNIENVHKTLKQVLEHSKELNRALLI